MKRRHWGQWIKTTTLWTYSHAIVVQRHSSDYITTQRSPTDLEGAMSSLDQVLAHVADGSCLLLCLLLCLSEIHALMACLEDQCDRCCLPLPA